MGVAEVRTRDRILDAAQNLVQSNGYNAVSYRDLAEHVGITSASIHYHFPAKGDLGEALVERYRSAFTAARQRIDESGGTPSEQLSAFVGALSASFRSRSRMCLCAVLAAEAASLPEPVVDQVKAFFRENEAWLAGVLTRARRAGKLRTDDPPDRAARGLFAALEGAIMSAWTFGDEKRLSEAGRWLVASVVER